MRLLFDITKFVLYFFFSKVIFISLVYFKLKKIKLFYTDHAGFGDHLFYCVEIRKKLTVDQKIFCYSKLQLEVAEFFFDKKYISKSFILMPKLMSESHLVYRFLSKKKFFNPTNLFRLKDNKKIPISDYYSGNDETIKYIHNKIDKSKISNSLVKIFNKPTICIYIKNFSLQKNNHINFQVRQTRDLNKILDILKFLNVHDYNIIILGKEKDHFIKLLPNNIKNGNEKNIFLLKNISRNYSIADQAYVAKNAVGFLGSASGAMGFFGILNKRVILIDAVSYYADKYWKNFTFLYKKAKNKIKNEEEIFVWKKYYDPNNYEIVETTYDEIEEIVKIQF